MIHTLRSAGGLLVAAMLLAGCASSGQPTDVWPYPVPPSAGGAGSTEPGAPGEHPAPPEPPPVVRPSQPPPPPPDVQPPLLNTYPRSIEASGVAAPVLALVKQAREAKKGRKYDQAEAALERALRIEPRNPWVWQQLASLHLAAGQGDQAATEARKSNSLAKRNPWIEVENYRVLSEALSGAPAAQAKVRYEDRQRWITTPPYATPNTGK